MKSNNYTTNANVSNTIYKDITYNDNNTCMNSNTINQEFSTNQSNPNKRKQMSYQKDIYDYDSRNNNLHKSGTKDPKNNLNPKLSPENYVKPLYYLLNGQVKAINKQFLGYKDNRRFLYYNQYPTNKHSIIRLKKNPNGNEEKKEDINSKNKSKNTQNNQKKSRNKKSSVNDVIHPKRPKHRRDEHQVADMHQIDYENILVPSRHAVLPFIVLQSYLL